MDFERSFEKVVGHEGGYVNDPKDPGGETKYGICKASYPDLDIKNLTIEDAKEIYLDDYWIKSCCDKIPLDLAYPVFDCAVNQGVGTAIKLLQKSLSLKTDGIVGSATLSKLKSISKGEALVVKRDFLTERALKYTKTKNFDRFGRGWLRRVIDIALH